MFPKEVTEFLKTLSQNNNKTWFDANRKHYEKIKNDFTELVQAIIFLMGEFEPEFVHLEPKDCIYRINRDIRFSKDKTPYKTYLSAAFSKHGRKTEDPGYYFHIDEEGVLRIDGGLWNPDRTKLELVRQSIETYPEKLLEILEEKDFKKYFGDLLNDRLTKVPRGYDPENPYIELLKLKSFVGEHEVKVQSISEKELPKYIADGFKKLHPLVMYLMKIVSKSNKQLLS